MPTAGAPGIPSGFIALFVIVAVIGIGGAIWRAVVLSRGGLNPFVAKEQLEARLARRLQDAETPMPSASLGKTIEERLAELDDLRERGVISAEELAAGRAKIIGGNLGNGPRSGVIVGAGGRRMSPRSRFACARSRGISHGARLATNQAILVE